MKKILKITMVLFFLNTAIPVFIPQEAFPQQVAMSFQIFYDELSPYGMWVDYPHYGYVWIPRGYVGFSPYKTGGYWAYSEFGWTWVSYYPWGWIPFHYGRWYFDPVYGWLWVPGHEWGPAWVVWVSGGGYYGWAPMAPGISISLFFGSTYSYPSERWVFVRDRDFGRPDVSNYYVSRSNNVTIINNTKVIKNTYEDKSRNATYVSGPNREEVQKVSGKEVKQFAIRESSKPGQQVGNNEFRMYRPHIQKGEVKGQKPAPSRVTDLKDVKPVGERDGAKKPERMKQQEKEKISQSRKEDAPVNKEKKQPSNQVSPPDKSKKIQPSQPKDLSQPAKKGKEPDKNISPPQRDKKVEPPPPRKPQYENQPEKREERKEQPPSGKPADRKKPR